jgi:hypothetical protein
MAGFISPTDGVNMAGSFRVSEAKIQVLSISNSPTRSKEGGHSWRLVNTMRISLGSEIQCGRHGNNIPNNLGSSMGNYSLSQGHDVMERCLQGDPAFTAVVFQDENPRLGDHTLGTIERWFKHQILSSFIETLQNATIHLPPAGPILRQSPHNPCLFLQERLSDLTSNAYVNTPGLIIVHFLSHKHLH